MIRYEVKRQEGLTLLEFIGFAVLVSLFVMTVMTLMMTQARKVHLAHRSQSLSATAAVSAENKVATFAYTKCWHELKSTSPECALEIVALAKSQGRSEEGAAELIGQMGIFENGCVDPDNSNVFAVRQSPELSSLMTRWCAAHAPKTETAASATVD